MDEQTRRIWELENALHQAIWTVEFLHGCLTKPDLYSYDFPEQTEYNLTEWRELTPPPTLCAHSAYQAGCPSCEARRARISKG